MLIALISKGQTMNSIKTAFNTVYSTDGVDHICVNPYGATRMGKICAPSWRKQFFIPQLGTFGSPSLVPGWIVSRDDKARWEKVATPFIKEFEDLALYAKFFQLCAMRAELESHRELVNLPWFEYRTHASGVREYARSERYTETVKGYVLHILNNGTDQPPEVAEMGGKILEKLKE